MTEKIENEFVPKTFLKRYSRKANAGYPRMSRLVKDHNRVRQLIARLNSRINRRVNQVIMYGEAAACICFNSWIRDTIESMDENGKIVLLETACLVTDKVYYMGDPYRAYEFLNSLLQKSDKDLIKEVKDIKRG